MVEGIVVSETKVCARCHYPKPLTNFQPTGKRPGERRATCRACRRPGNRDGSSKPTPKFLRSLAGKRYIITSAQNATAVHEKFFAALKVAAADLGAELVVIPLRYRNPTSKPEASRADDAWWSKETEPYLFNGRKKLGPNIVLVADVKSQPTASHPLTGFENLTGRESCIIGHPKMQFKVVAVPSGRYPKTLSTTGACTLSNNYSDTRAGKVGEFHHYLGAVLVELRGKHFWLRQLNANRADGSFIDLDKEFTAEGVRPAPPPLAFAFGDSHVKYHCPNVDRATFGAEGIVETLDPERKARMYFHDVNDNDYVNHHEANNPFLQVGKVKSGDSVHQELLDVVNFVNKRADGRDAFLVDSNHNGFLTRWVLEHDWKTDPSSAAFYLETALAMVHSVRRMPNGTAYDDPFHYWVKKFGIASNIRLLGPDESSTVAGIEMGMHGHRGPNGSRGSLQNLSKLGTKVVTGHSHTPGIEAGHYQVGTSTPLRLQYTHGPSSWLNTHAVVYANGARALLTVIDGRWRA